MLKRRAKGKRLRPAHRPKKVATVTAKSPFAEPPIPERLTGYRTLNQDEVWLINAIKEHAEHTGALVSRIEQAASRIDGRWLSIGRTHLQEGFMALTRAIARPSTF